MRIQPQILDLKKQTDKNTFRKLLKSHNPQIVDDYKNQLEELGMVKNPTLLKNPVKPLKLRIKETDGVWVYYPWRNTLVHCLDKKGFHQLRTSRNKNLITDGEQSKFEKFRIGIAGLNVGNPAARCIVSEGGGWNIKFADNDVLSLSNMNRFQASIADLGLNKAVLSARQCHEVNPFLNIDILPEGIKSDEIDNFLLKPRIDILIEEMDNLPLKIKIRERARKHRIPVVMVTGNGENIIIDVERFDKEPNLRLLNGLLKHKIIKGVAAGPKTLDEKIALARDFMGSKYLVKRLRDSFRLVGSKLAGIPQLAEASFLRGAALCYFIRLIAAGSKVPSGRYILRLGDIIKK